MERRDAANKTHRRRVEAFIGLLDLIALQGKEPLFVQILCRDGSRSECVQLPPDDPDEEEDETAIDMQPPRHRYAEDTAEAMEKMLPGPEKAGTTTDVPSPQNPPLVRDLLEMFVQEGCRMSGGEAFLWLREHGKRYAEGTVKQTLCRLRREAILTNIEDSRGVGYGLSEWA